MEPSDATAVLIILASKSRGLFNLRLGFDEHRYFPTHLASSYPLV